RFVLLHCDRKPGLKIINDVLSDIIAVVDRDGGHIAPEGESFWAVPHQCLPMMHIRERVDPCFVYGLRQYERERVAIIIDVYEPYRVIDERVVELSHRHNLLPCRI